MSSEDVALERLQNFLDYQGQHEYSKTTLADGNIKAVSVKMHPTDPTLCNTVFEMEVAQSLSNGLKALHGGAVATIFDILTSMNIVAVAREGFWKEGHVTRTLNCTYLRPAMVGSKVLIESETVHLGKNMCLIKGVMRRKSDGAICYTCEHGKVRLGRPTI